MTNLESTVINALYDICLLDQCGFDALADETGLTTSVLRGVVSSLQKKGIAKVVDNGYVTIIVVENTEWPSDFFSEEEWAEKKAAALKEAARERRAA
jgi:predicted transcriptional regulator of viral defense system